MKGSKRRRWTSAGCISKIVLLVVVEGVYLELGFVKRFHKLQGAVLPM